VRLQSWSGCFEREKILLTIPGIQPTHSIVAVLNASSRLPFTKYENEKILEDCMIGHVTCIEEKRNTGGFGSETAEEQAVMKTKA
jgi:hypothetical protein